MKKLITICLVIVTLFAGAMTIEAKTTKKTSKANKAKQTSSVIAKFTFNGNS